MTPQSLLPDNWILATGLFYWLPGEVISRKIWRINPPKFGKSWYLLLLTPCLLAIYSFLQSNSGLVNEGRLLFKLSLACVVGSSTYILCTGERLLSNSSRKENGLELYSCILFAYYMWFLTLLWWLPAGVRSIWIWPLQFEPRLITGITALIAVCISLLSTRIQIPLNRRLCLATFGCILWQISGIFGKSLSIKEIALSEKITGYLGASRLFSGTSDIARSYGDRIGMMPFHVNTHPAGKVLLMKILDDISNTHAPYLWTLLIVSCVSLIVPLTYKISRLLIMGENQSSLVATSVSLIPSIALFCPGFDAYTAFLCTLLLLSWIKGLSRISSKHSPVIFGCIAGVIGYILLTFSYTGLVYGSVLIFWSPWILRKHIGARSWAKGFKRFLAMTFSALGVLSCVELAAYILTGYSNLISLFRSIGIQSTIEASNRSGFNAFLLDFTDFCYGVSPVLFTILLLLGAKIAVNCLSNLSKNKSRQKILVTSHGNAESLAALTLASLAVVALSGFLDIETARVWMMLMVPVVISAQFWLTRYHNINTFRSVLFCQSIWGMTLLLRYQFLF